jgi:hypothetical protein
VCFFTSRQPGLRMGSENQTREPAPGESGWLILTQIKHTHSNLIVLWSTAYHTANAKIREHFRIHLLPSESPMTFEVGVGVGADLVENAVGC